MAESPQHQELKRLAFLWARESGYRACATEVLLPKCNFRADVAACLPAARGSAEAGITALFECKYTRSDLLRDNAEAEAARAPCSANCTTGGRPWRSCCGCTIPPSPTATRSSRSGRATRWNRVSHEGYQALLRDIQVPPPAAEAAHEIREALPLPLRESLLSRAGGWHLRAGGDAAGLGHPDAGGRAAFAGGKAGLA